MENGEISGNINSPGVSVYGDAPYTGSSSFTMEGGEISGNGGSGVSVSGSIGSFFMKGGTIYGNTAFFSGGGVNVSGGSFNKTGGTIYGNTGTGNANVAKNGGSSPVDEYGHAVFYLKDASTRYYRDDTLDGTAAGNISTANTGSGWTAK
jgi:hypothetical protein